jgi:hypothetical protein
MRITNFDAKVLAQISPTRWKSGQEILKDFKDSYGELSTRAQWAALFTEIFPEMIVHFFLHRSLGIDLSVSVRKFERLGLVKARLSPVAFEEYLIVVEYILTSEGYKVLRMREKSKEKEISPVPVPA